MSGAEFTGISHFDLTVRDAELSAQWYEKVFGVKRLRRADFPSRIMIVLKHELSGLIIGLNQHQQSKGELFDEFRTGLDHVGFAVRERSDLDDWERRLASLGVLYSTIGDVESGSALVFRDPDNIQLEFWWTKV